MPPSTPSFDVCHQTPHSSQTFPATTASAASTSHYQPPGQMSAQLYNLGQGVPTTDTVLPSSATDGGYRYPSPPAHLRLPNPVDTTCKPHHVSWGERSVPPNTGPYGGQPPYYGYTPRSSLPAMGMRPYYGPYPPPPESSIGGSLHSEPAQYGPRLWPIMSDMSNTTAQSSPPQVQHLPGSLHLEPAPYATQIWPIMSNMSHTTAQSGPPQAQHLPGSAFPFPSPFP